MKLKDYIREGYNIVTTPNLAYKIQEDYPNALVFTDRALDAIPIGKLLVDRYYSNNPAVLSVKSLQNAYAVESFNCEFTGYELDNKSNTNLLEIKLKDTDSVPEVYYKGQRIDESPKGLIDIAYHYHTTGDGSETPDGVNDISFEYYDLSDDSNHIDRKIIGHKRDL